MKSRSAIIRLAAILAFMLPGHLVLGQQLPLYSQYVFNKFLINPSAAGSDGFTSYNVTAREQWIGYSGAPRTYSLSYQTRVLKRKYRLKQNLFDHTVYVPKKDGRVGLGAYIFSDRNGLIEKTGFQTSYSYHAWITDYTQMSLGMGLSGYFYRINVNATSFEASEEPLLYNDLLRRGVFIPDIDFGIYILNPRFDIGFSALQLVGAAAKIGNAAYNNYWMDRHFYLFGSYDFRAGLKGELEPAFLVKMSEQMRPQADIGFNYIHDRGFWAGLTYRTGGALIANVRFKVIPSRINMTSLFFGYAFDFTVNKIQRVTYGTHEITMAVKFGDSAKRFRWMDRY
jgi:type IX secretion system PorP/SprF family membrane protein